MTLSHLCLPISSLLQTLGLALMIGGMLALGAFTAPVLFKSMARPQAGEAMTVIFCRYDKILLASAILVILGEGLRLCTVFCETGQWMFDLTPFNLLRTLVLIMLVGLTLYTTLVLNPKMAAIQKDPQFHQDTQLAQQFQQRHEQSESFYKVQLLAAFFLLCLNAFVPRP